MKSCLLLVCILVSLVAAHAEITAADKIRVWADGVSDPVNVRYNWANFPKGRRKRSFRPACPPIPHR